LARSKAFLAPSAAIRAASAAASAFYELPTFLVHNRHVNLFHPPFVAKKKREQKKGSCIPWSCW
jgi:hypothetical protein